MDEFDKALLEQMQINARQTADQLSEKVGLSSSACQRRLALLRETGAIEKEVAIISHAAAGQHLMMVVEVTLERERPDLIDTFKRSMQKIPEIMQCFYVTGSTDFILVITARDMEHYERFSRRVFFENTNIKRFQTNVVMDRVKTGQFVPVFREDKES